MVKYIVQLRDIVCFSESSLWNSNEIVENQHIDLLFIQKNLSQGSFLPFL